MNGPYKKHGPSQVNLFAYFHSTIKHGIIIWGNSSNSGKIFTLQKKTVRIIAGTKPRTSCSCPLKKLEILPVP